MERSRLTVLRDVLATLALGLAIIATLTHFVISDTMCAIATLGGDGSVCTLR